MASTILYNILLSTYMNMEVYGINGNEVSSNNGNDEISKLDMNMDYYLFYVLNTEHIQYSTFIFFFLF